MTQAFLTTTVVGRPADVVWARLTDWPRAADWMPGVDAIRTNGTADPTAVGTELTVRARGKDRTSTVTALDPGRSLTLTSVQGGVTADYTYTLTPSSDDGTTVTLAAAVRTSGLWTVVAPLLRAAIRRADGGQLDTFRRVVVDRP